MSARGVQLDGWDLHTFKAAGLEREYYRRGDGPLVVVVHEVPGITPPVMRFADEVVARGFTVAMPNLIGTPGKPMTNGYAVSSLAKVCVAREFAALATNKTSPIVSWLRALARHLHPTTGGKGVGAVGMCFSGGFALGMMVDDLMLAPVLSQPSMPFPIGAARKGSIHLSADDAAVVAERAAQGCQVLGLRYDADPLVGDRFATLRSMLGDSFIGVELPSRSKKDHSVLTEQRDDAAVERVLEFFENKLK